MADIGLEVYCNECEATTVYEDEYDFHEGKQACPKCKSRDIVTFPFVTCHCGERVYLSRHGDTECNKCGALINAFGQTISHLGYYDDYGDPEGW